MLKTLNDLIATLKANNNTHTKHRTKTNIFTDKERTGSTIISYINNQIIVNWLRKLSLFESTLWMLKSATIAFTDEPLTTSGRTRKKNMIIKL